MSETMSTKEKVLTFVGFAMAIIGIACSGIAWIKWNGNVDEFNGVVANWQKGPISAVEFAPASCSSGFTPFEDQDDFSYKTLECDCSKDKKQKNTVGTCTKNQKKGNCTDYNNIKTFPVPKWREEVTFCVKREADLTPEKRVRAGAGSCPSTTPNECPDGGCVSGECPINQWRVELTNVTSTEEQMKIGNGIYSLFYSRDAVGEGPIIDLSISQGAVKKRYSLGDKTTAYDLVVSNSKLDTLKGNAVVWNAAERSAVWSLGYRREIEWKSDCVHDRTAVIAIAEKVSLINTCQLANMIISICAGLFNVVALCIIIKQNTDDDSSNDDAMKGTKEKCNLVCELIVLSVTVLATYVSFSAKSFFVAMSTDTCSVDYVNDTFQYLADQIEITTTLNAIKLLLTILYFIFKIVKFCCGGIPCLGGDDRDREKEGAVELEFECAAYD